MKANIHPAYFSDAQVVCACGNVFTSGSTKQQIRVEICSKCHPFFTGQQKFVDTIGKIDKFQAKVQQAKVKQESIAAHKKEKKEREDRRPLSLREMLLAGKS